MKRVRAIPLLLALVLIVLGLGLRLYHLDAQSYWSDEGASVTLALGPLEDIAPKSAADIHPPFYYYLLWAWVHLLGPGEFAARLPSALAGTLLVALTFAMGRRAVGTGPAVVGAFLCAISPLLIYYSQEARMYELMALWGALSAWLILLLEARLLPSEQASGIMRQASRLARFLARPTSTDHPPRISLYGLALWASYIIVAVLGLYTQYFFFTVLLWQNIYVLYRVSCILYRTRDWKAPVRRLLLPWIAAQAIVGGLFLPWALRAGGQLTGWPSYGAPFALPDLLSRVVVGFTFGPAAAETLTDKAAWVLWGLVALAGLALLWNIAREWRAQGPNPKSHTQWAAPSPKPKAPTFVMLYLFVPIITVYVLSQNRPMDKPDFLKQILAAVPAYCLFLALGVDGLGRVGSWVTGDLIVGRLARGSATVVRAGHWIAGKLALGRLDGTVGDVARAGHETVDGLAFGRFAQASQRVTDKAAAALVGSMAGAVVRVVVVVAALAVLAFFTSRALDAAYHNPKYARDDYRGLAARIAASEQPGDAVVLNAPGQIEILNLYYHGSAARYPLPRQRPIDEAITTADLEAITAQHSRVWLVLWAVEESDPDRLVESWLDAHAYKTLDQWYGNVRLALYQVSTAGTTGIEYPLRLNLGEAIALLGYNLPPSARAGEILPLTLFWQALAPMDRRYKVFAHVIDDHEILWGQRDAEPLSYARPTTTWAAGEVLTDTYGLQVLPGTPPGTYHVEVGMYGVDDGVRLPVHGADTPLGDRVLLGPLTVARPHTPPPTEALLIPRPLERDLGDGIQLLGYSLTRWDESEERTDFAAGEVAHLTLFWRATAQPGAEYRVRVQLLDDAGSAVFSQEAPPAQGNAPTTSWQPGDAVRDQHRLSLAGVTPRTYRLVVTLVAGDERVLGSVELGPVAVR